jgi:sigma-B regulation protein RsbU (phosphoserine phosphatase)
MSQCLFVPHRSTPPAHLDVLNDHLRDLEGARHVQQGLFPRELPRLPGWECAAVCRPARVVAGDYYDLFEAAPGRVAVVLGDAAGKGPGPALVMAALHALVRSRLRPRPDDLGGLMREINLYLLGATPADMFVTLFLAVLDVTSGRLDYVNGGHPQPLVLAGPGAELVRLAAGGPLLGVVPAAHYGQGQIDLGPGSALALYSDGVTEALGPGGERFQERRLLDVLRATHASAAAALTRVVAAVERFAGAGGPQDDVTLLILRRQEHRSPTRAG